ncbi:ornithine cyclodeaminase family protein [Streptomyces sp. NPDC056190]|uniref:ornithine cyclodeaminase family protein n=1 Tax=unclassified Streptomyces TaxID=2593676 RepID=UPI0035D9F3FB
MTLLLTRSDVLRMLTFRQVIDAVEQAHAELARGGAAQPAPAALRLPGSDSVYVPMAAASAHARAVGVKLLADIPTNAGRGLPVQQTTLMIINTETGACEALLDGAAVTRYRTAAASAVASRHLARPDSRVLGLVGAGAQARAHALALRAVLPIEQVRIWNRSPERAVALAAELGAEGFGAEAVDDIRKAVSGVDVLCTVTPSHDPLVRGAWFQPGLHVNAVGAPPRPDHREIDTDGVLNSRVVVDSYATALEKSGDVLLPLHEGAITKEHFRTELGQVITSAQPGRESLEQITLYNSVGLGLQDVATARLLIDQAAELGVGTRFDLTL